MTGTKLICYFDILGFKDIVNNNSHEELLEIYNMIIPSMLNISLGFGKFQIYCDSVKNTWKPDFENFNLNSLIVSDSIVIWSEEVSIKKVIEILAVSKGFIHDMMVIGLPIRAAITLGEIDKIENPFPSFMDNKQISVVGKGLVDAYLMEENQEWAGGVISNSVIQYIEDNDKRIELEGEVAFNLIGYLSEKNVIIKYSPPLKREMDIDYCINWVKSPKNEKIVDKAKIKEFFKGFKKDISDDRIVRKINNTLSFINHIEGLRTQ